MKLLQETIMNKDKATCFLIKWVAFVLKIYKYLKKGLTTHTNMFIIDMI